uniref:RxLR effector candidate protein n=1 Tax=Hyaloperonospora arabidopsidis (strain Emoy2) TaxID=559515 RepID=M4C1V3_HYAAE
MICPDGVSAGVCCVLVAILSSLDGVAACEIRQVISRQAFLIRGVHKWDFGDSRGPPFMLLEKSVLNKSVVLSTIAGEAR